MVRSLVLSGTVETADDTVSLLEVLRTGTYARRASPWHVVLHVKQSFAVGEACYWIGVRQMSVSDFDEMVFIDPS